MYITPVSHGTAREFSRESLVDHTRVASVRVPNYLGEGVEIKPTKFDPHQVAKVSGVSSAIF